ncbi:MAG: phosphatidate cytidylyltransferase [Methanobacterium sp. BRmetb2]|nr:MAG: phosphatidate cytidylyltransferase [Methanobacterium sp. BRmetb2]
MRKEISRQLIHASGILIILLEKVFDPIILIIICGLIVLTGELISFIDKKKYIPFFSTVLRSCRRSEDEKGYIYFFVGVLMALVIFNFNLNIANATIIILVLGDAASTLIGKRFGKIKLPYHEYKTLEGSTAFLIVGFLGALLQIPLLPAFLGAFFGAIAEAYSPIDDNLVIPIVCGSVISVVMYLI